MAEGHGLRLAAPLPGGIIGPSFARGAQSTDCARAIVMRAHMPAAEGDVSGRFVVGADARPSLSEIIRPMRGIAPSVPRPLVTMPAMTCPLLPLYDAAFGRLFGKRRARRR